MSQREESILLALKRFDYLTRDQINTYFRLGTLRNTNRILGDLSDYLMIMRDGYQSIYYLGKEGRIHVDSKKIVKKNGNVEHAIMRNQFWIYYGCPGDWKNEVKVSDGKTVVICDAMFTQSLRYHFLEVDRTQTMRENRIKIERYKQLHDNGLITQKLGHFPTIIWLTTTELRRKQLQEACKSLPLTKVYTFADIK